MLSVEQMSVCQLKAEIRFVKSRPQNPATPFYLKALQMELVKREMGYRW